MDPNVQCPMQSMMECYNVFGGPRDDEDLRNINIPRTKGIQDVVAPDVPMDPMSHPLNIRKVNIETKKNTMFVNIGDYWDEETMVKITDFLHEFHDFFSDQVL